MDQNEGSYLAPRNNLYDEIPSLANAEVYHVRGSGDGQNVEESKQSPLLNVQSNLEAVHYASRGNAMKQRTKAGSTGPIEKSSMKVVNFKDDDDHDVYKRLGITSSFDGDRLSPSTKLLECESSSGSINVVYETNREGAAEDITANTNTEMGYANQNSLPLVSSEDDTDQSEAKTNIEALPDDPTLNTIFRTAVMEHNAGTVENESLSDDVFLNEADGSAFSPLKVNPFRRLTFPQKSRHCPTCSCASCDTEHKVMDPILIGKGDGYFRRMEKKRKSEEAFEQALRAKISSASGFVTHRKEREDEHLLLENEVNRNLISLI